MRTKLVPEAWIILRSWLWFAKEVDFHAETVRHHIRRQLPFSRADASDQ